MADIWMDVDTALGEVPVNMFPLIDDTDFKTIEDAVVYNQAGLALFWNFVTTAGVQTSTAVTPTTAGVYDWTDQGTSGLYSIEIPASGGASANNDTEGFGWFTGVATGICPWKGPIIGFRAAALNNALIDGGDNLDVNVAQWLGTAVNEDTAGYPKVTVKDGTGTGEIALTSGKVDGVALVDTTTTNTDMVSEPPTAAAVVNEWETQSQADPTGFHVNVMEVNSVAEDIATETKQDTAQSDLDIITGATGVNLLAATQASIDAIEADTNELQTNQGNWLTATGFSTLDKTDVASAMKDTDIASTNPALGSVYSDILGPFTVDEIKERGFITSGTISKTINGATQKYIVLYTTDGNAAGTRNFQDELLGALVGQYDETAASKRMMLPVLGFYYQDAGDPIAVTQIKGIAALLGVTATVDLAAASWTGAASEVSGVAGYTMILPYVDGASFDNSNQDLRIVYPRTFSQMNLANVDLGDGFTFGEALTSMAGKTADSGSYDRSTDSQEAIRDKETDIETDTQDIQSRIPAALVSGKMDSDMTAISGDTDQADRLEQAMEGTIHGAVNTIPAAATTLLVKSLTNDTLADLNQTDLLKNRVLTFITGVCQGQSVGISGQTASGSDPITLTVTTMVNFANIAVDDEFVIT